MSFSAHEEFCQNDEKLFTEETFVKWFFIENGHIIIEFADKRSFDICLNLILQVNPYSRKHNKRYSQMDLHDSEKLKLIIPHEFSQIIDVVFVGVDLE